MYLYRIFCIYFSNIQCVFFCVLACTLIVFAFVLNLCYRCGSSGRVLCGFCFGRKLVKRVLRSNRVVSRVIDSQTERKIYREI